MPEGANVSRRTHLIKGGILLTFAHFNSDAVMSKRDDAVDVAPEIWSGDKFAKSKATSHDQSLQ